MTVSSALRPAGSTSRWRKIRRAILARDGWRCRVPTTAGTVCDVELIDHERDGTRCPGSPSCDVDRHAHVDHVVDRADAELAGLNPDAPSNLRASCQLCNLRRAADRTNRARAVPTSRRW